MIVVRDFDLDDRDQVVALWNDAFDNPTGHNEPNGVINQKLAMKDGLFFVAADGNSIVGTIMAGFDGHRGWLYSVAVVRVYRRRGIGARLVSHAESKLVKLGCDKL
ncbi:MAG: GNAT family N-acetyltransferase, partial [Planctomycetota bacterium]